MKRVISAVAAAVFGAGVLGLAARPASAAGLCVGTHNGCFATLQAAVNAAHDGDTIQLAPGTYAGGVTITKSLQIQGGGAQNTTLSGGGPVLTIGTFFGDNTETVSIRGVTITGGFNDSQPQTQVVFGGGIWIPVSNDQATGATVTIANSVITGNTVSPSDTFDFCGHPCAFGLGGGIDNGGTLTLTNSQVTDNQVGAAGSAGTGLNDGGIENRFSASLTLRNCLVSGNRAVAGPPNGLGASSGGIGDDGQMTIDNSVVSGNSVELAHAVTSDLDEGAFAGGIAISDFADSSATIRNTTVSGNTVTASNTVGDEGAFAGGILDEGSLVLGNSSVDHNTVVVTAAGDAFVDGGGLEVDGVATIANSTIAANGVTATTATGQAFSQGGGLANVGQTTLSHTNVVGNTVTAGGTGGLAQGGGIWNGTFNPGDPQPLLTLVESTVSGNRVAAGGGITSQGGGIFTTAPIVLNHTAVSGNAPDQVVGP